MRKFYVVYIGSGKNGEYTFKAKNEADAIAKFVTAAKEKLAEGYRSVSLMDTRGVTLRSVGE